MLVVTRTWVGAALAVAAATAGEVAADVGADVGAEVLAPAAVAALPETGALPFADGGVAGGWSPGAPLAGALAALVPGLLA
ncbi:MAG: hypothetical protein JOZ93_17910 [Sinobacteraceae bacterium]|nr:hypothetical protein [Nevskiaceae bacterium]